jgi:hypothetical protein
VAFGEKKLGLDRQLLAKIFEDAIPQWDDSQTIDVEGMLHAIEILKEVGDLTQSYRPEIDRIADLRFIDAGQ